MPAERIETIIIGGGQAGLSLSYYLSQAGREHLVLEKASQPADAWRSQRWDSFTLVTPNWTFKLPGAEYRDDRPGAFMPRAEIVERFDRYVAANHLPVRTGVSVTAVEPDPSGGYSISTANGGYHARNVVVATGLFQKAKVPSVAAQLPAEVAQVACIDYRNPQALPPGAVLVVGSAQTGAQIAEELHESGRKVYLATSAAPHAPRRYRGRDTVEWLAQIGFFDRTADQLASPAARFAPNPNLTGKNGGHSLNLHQFARDGIVLLGHLRGFENGQFFFAPDLPENLVKADQAQENLVQKIEGYIQKAGIQAPPEEKPAARQEGYRAPQIESLDLKESGIAAVIWACGFAFDYSLVRLPVTDSFGYPLTHHLATRYPGLYFLGMPWLNCFKSGLLVGVGEDAAYLSSQIAA